MILQVILLNSSSNNSLLYKWIYKRSYYNSLLSQPLNSILFMCDDVHSQEIEGPTLRGGYFFQRHSKIDFYSQVSRHVFLKLINNSSGLNKGNHDRDGVPISDVWPHFETPRSSLKILVFSTLFSMFRNLVIEGLSRLTYYIGHCRSGKHEITKGSKDWMINNTFPISFILTDTLYCFPGSNVVPSEGVRYILPDSPLSPYRIMYSLARGSSTSPRRNRTEKQKEQGVVYKENIQFKGEMTDYSNKGTKHVTFGKRL